MKQPAIRRVVCILAISLAILTGTWNGAVAQQRQVPARPAEVQLSFAPVVKHAAPAVVNVYVRSQVQRRSSPFFNDPFFRRFFNEDFGIQRKRVQNSLGSGVIVSPDGVIVTNYHVIKTRGKAQIKIALADKREFPARVILKDERTDLAVLKLDAPGIIFPFLDFEDSEQLQVGDIVLAIGNPFGVGQTVTSGIVSALARTRVGVSDYQFFIQTDAAINPGNSGGALVDVKGRLVGVNTAIYSRSGGSQGIGFAIPSNMVRQVVQSALHGNTVKRPWFGAKLQRVTPDIAESLGLDRPAGALIKQVKKNSPAAQSKLRSGDVIVAVNGKKVADPRAFRYRFSTKPIGGTVPLGIIRQAKLMTINVPLRVAPEIPKRNVTILKGRNPFAGVSVANLSPALAEELSIDEQSYGVIVLKVTRGTPASNSRFLLAGDIIVATNGKKVKSVKQLSKLINERSHLWRVSVRRKGRILNVVIEG